MNTSDQKSIFGIFVGLAALFALWLWASGNASTLWAAATGQSTAPTASGTTASSSGGPDLANSSFGSYAAPATVSTVTQPTTYVNTVPAIQIPSAQAIGGNTTAGAQSAGVSVTPTVLANSTSIPSFTDYTPITVN